MSPPSPRRALALGTVLLLLLSSACELADCKPLLFVPIPFSFSASTNSSSSVLAQLLALSLQNKVDKLAVIMDKFALQGVTVTNTTTTTTTNNNNG